MKRSIKQIFILLLLTLFICGISFGTTYSTAFALEGADGSRTLLAFTSDVHNTEIDDGANRLQTWIMNEQQAYGNEIDYMGFCGDLGRADSSRITESQYWTYTQNVMDVADTMFPNKVCYTTGNHELEHGKYDTTTNPIKDRFTVDAVASGAPSSCQIYCMGSREYQPSWNNNVNKYKDEQVTALQEYLSGCDASKPVFIISHYPLHLYSTRYTTNSDKVIDALNNAADKGMTIVFLWGHNHTKSDSTYDEIHKPNDTLQYESGKTKTIKFTYAAAGCMSDTEYSDGSSSVKGKGLIVEVLANNAMTFAYYDAKGNNVTEGGTQEVLPSNPTCTVVFSTNGPGIAPASQTVTSGEKLTKPADLTASCYNFGGWFKDISCTEEWDFAQDTVTESRILYAKWTETGHDWSFEDFVWIGNATNGYTAAIANYICAGNASHTKAGQATLESTVIQPTCTEGGKTVYTASIAESASLDNNMHTASKDAKLTNAKGHSLTKYTGSAATCTKAGASDYWKCKTCNKYFSDKDGQNEITEGDWVIEKLSHILSHQDAVAATCASAGNLEYWKCSTCNQYFKDADATEVYGKDEWKLAILDHDYGPWTKLNDTQHQRICSNDASHKETENHTWDNGSITTPATATTAGVKTFTCTVCGATKTETIQPTGSSSGGSTPSDGGSTPSSGGSTPSGGGSTPSGGGSTPSDGGSTPSGGDPDPTGPTEADQAAANGVIEAIANALLREPIDLESEDAVIAARSAYDGLTAEQKELVPSETLDKLAAAESTILKWKQYNTDIAEAKAVPSKLVKIKNAKGRKATITWKKNKNSVGYQVWCSTDKKFKKSVKKYNAKAGASKLTIKKLKKGKTYYFKVCTLTEVTNAATGEESIVRGKLSGSSRLKIKK